MERRHIEPLFFAAVLLGTAVVVFLLFRPFLYILALASILAYITSSLYKKLLLVVRSPSLTACVMTLLVVLTLVIPFTLIGLRITYEAADMYAYVSDSTTNASLNQSMQSAQAFLDRYAPGIVIDSSAITDKLGLLFGWVVSNVGVALGSFASLLVNFLLLLLFYFYLIRDGAAMFDRLKKISPLASQQEDRIAARIGTAISSTVRGSFVMALLQGLVSGIGFTLFGVPNPVLWGTVVVLAAFIPTVGTALIQVPVVAYLALSGNGLMALLATLWAMLAVGMLDNFLGPRIMSRGMHMHPLVMLLGILGGVSFYGPIGVLLGPITVALLYALLDIYVELTHA